MFEVLALMQEVEQLDVGLGDCRQSRLLAEGDCSLAKLHLNCWKRPESVRRSVGFGVEKMHEYTMGVKKIS